MSFFLPSDFQKRSKEQYSCWQEFPMVLKHLCAMLAFLYFFLLLFSS